jgi:hypothetical protein
MQGPGLGGKTPRRKGQKALDMAGQDWKNRDKLALIRKPWDFPPSPRGNVRGGDHNWDIKAFLSISLHPKALSRNGRGSYGISTGSRAGNQGGLPFPQITSSVETSRSNGLEIVTWIRDEVESIDVCRLPSFL